MNDYVVVLSKRYIGYPLYKAKECKVITPYSLFPENKLFRKLRSILYKYNKTWTIGINRNLKNAASTYILYDSISPVVANYIRKNNPEARIIVYYINPEKYSYPFEAYSDARCEIWTFDDRDAKEKCVPWNPLHYFGTIKDTNHSKNVDVLFVGADKGRYEYLKSFEKKLNLLGVSTKFIITPTSDFPFYNRKKYSKRVNYEENINYVLQARAVLDIMQKGQTGYTMRITETMVNHIKLITNNTNIKNYDFYCPENIFILGKNDINELPDFLESNWNSSKDNVISDLEFEYWIGKFGID